VENIALATARAAGVSPTHGTLGVDRSPREFVMAHPLRPITIALLTALTTAGLSPARAEQATGPARVVDGDTLEVGGIRFRLAGIDAPEKRQGCDTAEHATWGCGRAATEALQMLVGGRIVVCFGTSTSYDRTVGQCQIAAGTASGGTARARTTAYADVAAELVRRGLAWASVDYRTEYAGEEAEARLAAVGVWRAPNTERAWTYRRGGPPQVPPAGRPIKANVRADGTCVYHLPSSGWYGRTRIKPGEGDQWVASAAEAEALGCRAARSPG
jgi:endonuclease YncB( thermonuclease family)